MTASEVLKGCNDVNSLLKFVKSLNPQIGTWGGRRFTNEKKEGGSICINDVILRLNTLYPILPKTENDQKNVESLITEIQSKNKQADSLRDNSSLLMRILTAIKSWFASFSVNRNHILSDLSLAISTELQVIRLNEERQLKEATQKEQDYQNFVELAPEDKVKEFKNLSWDLQIRFAKDHFDCLLVLADKTPAQTQQKIDLLKQHIDSFFKVKDYRGLAYSLTQMQNHWQATSKDIDLLYREDFLAVMHCLMASDYWNQIPLHKPSDPKDLPLFKTFCPGRVWFELFLKACLVKGMKWNEFDEGLREFIRSIITLCKWEYDPWVIQNKFSVVIPLARGFSSIIDDTIDPEQASKFRSTISVLAMIASDLDGMYAKKGIQGDFSSFFLKQFERGISEARYEHLIAILSKGPMNDRDVNTVKEYKPYMFLLSCILFANPSAFQRFHKIISNKLPENYLEIFKERCWHYSDLTHRQFINLFEVCKESIHQDGVPTLQSFCLQALERVSTQQLSLPQELKERLDIYVRGRQG